MNIRRARQEDLPEILAIYEEARVFMRENGNPNQWVGGYPGEELLKKDLAGDHLFVCENGQELLGVFAYFIGEDPTYVHIEGAWCNDAPYGVIHRLAVRTHGGGVARACIDFALSQCDNLRIDTHKDNIPMQRALEKYGFIPCGTIYLASGAPRIAFHKYL